MGLNSSRTYEKKKLLNIKTLCLLLITNRSVTAERKAYRGGDSNWHKDQDITFIPSTNQVHFCPRCLLREILPTSDRRNKLVSKQLLIRLMTFSVCSCTFLHPQMNAEDRRGKKLPKYCMPPRKHLIMTWPTRTNQKPPKRIWWKNNTSCPSRKLH